jgi:hypothetical protein
MKLNRPEYAALTLIMSVVCLLLSCISIKELKIFSPDYEHFLKPFSTKQIAVYSWKENRDTFIFYPVGEFLEKVRHIERGYYNRYCKYVKYELTPGSYHHNMKESKSYFVSLNNNSGLNMTSVWLNFLELGYDEDGINAQAKTNPMVFDRSTAMDSFTIVNENYCIKNFKFEKDSGIIEFTDCLGHIWSKTK